MKEILRSATDHDIPAIRSLWKSSFFDSDAYLDLFFKKRFDPLYTALYCFEKEIVGMVHLLPCEVKGHGKAFYWYAVSVDPKYRGKGIFTKMSASVLKSLQEKGYISVCKPVAGLENAYRKIGFDYAFSAKDHKIVRQANNYGNIAMISEAFVKDFQNVNFPKGSLLWKENDIEYAIAENAFCGGKSLKISVEGREACALAVLADDHNWYLDSTNLTAEFAKKCGNSICDYLNTDFFYLRKPTSPNDTDSFVSGLCDHPIANENSELFFTLW